MKQTEMQSLVDSLAEQRKRHLERVEKMHIQDIKELVRLLMYLMTTEKSELCTKVEDQGWVNERNQVQEDVDWEWQC